jgi:hypothetical protein
LLAITAVELETLVAFEDRARRLFLGDEAAGERRDEEQAVHPCILPHRLRSTLWVDRVDHPRWR